MDSQPNSSNNSNLSDDSSVNHQALIKEIMKMRGLPLDEKEKVLDVLADIMGYQHGYDSSLDEESTTPVQQNVSTQPQQSVQANIVDNNGKKVLEIKNGNDTISIRGYKAQLPRGSTVIRYHFSVNGQEEPITGPGTKSQKFGHTKDKVVEKLLNRLGSAAQTAISTFTQYDSSFYGTQG